MVYFYSWFSESTEKGGNSSDILQSTGLEVATPFWNRSPISPMLIIKPNSRAILFAKIRVVVPNVCILWLRDLVITFLKFLVSFETAL